MASADPSTLVPARLSTHRRSRFQNDPNVAQPQITSTRRTRISTTNVNTTSMGTGVLSPPKHLLESPQRRSVSKKQNLKANERGKSKAKQRLYSLDIQTTTKTNTRGKMGRSFVYVILGGGVAAGYAALEFTKKGVSSGELCIISDELVAPYERPALSKGFLLPEAPARLPGFHTCVGANEERLTPNWYKEHGIELILGTRVMSADVRRKTLWTAIGETIIYNYLIIATGARALKLEEIDITGSDAENVCYLRDLVDAMKLVNMMRKCSGGNAIVIGGGYIGIIMSCQTQNPNALLSNTLALMVKGVSL